MPCVGVKSLNWTAPKAAEVRGTASHRRNKTTSVIIRRCGGCRCRADVVRVTRSAPRVWTGQPAAVWTTRSVATTSRAASASRSAPTTTTLTGAAWPSVFLATASVALAPGRPSTTVSNVGRLPSMSIQRTRRTWSATSLPILQCKTYDTAAATIVRRLVFHFFTAAYGCMDAGQSPCFKNGKLYAIQSGIREKGWKSPATRCDRNRSNELVSVLRLGSGQI